MNRLLCLAKNVAFSNFTELRSPYKITYIVTHRCHFKCGMCNIWKKAPGSELSLEQIERFFDNSGLFSWVNLSGGEIFLRKDLPDIFDIILNKCRNLYLLDFPTNGYDTRLITDAVTGLLRDRRLPKLLVTVSLDGPPSLHDRIRNVPGSWDRAVETFDRLRKLRNGRFNVFLGMTLQRANMDKFEETLRSVDRKIGRAGYGDFHINIAHGSSHYYENPDFCKNEDAEKLWEHLDRISGSRSRRIFSAVGFLEKRYQALSKTYLTGLRSPLPCQALGASLFLSPDGTVYPCSVYDRPIGNIADFDYDIGRLWGSARRLQARKEIRAKNCPACWTPCEAYQSILANLLPKFQGGEH